MGLISRVSSRTYRKPETKSFSKKMAISQITKSRVPEGLAKKRSRFAKQAAAKQEAKAVAKKMTLVKQREVIAKARAYAAEYAAEAKAFVNNTKAAKAAGNYFVKAKRNSRWSSEFEVSTKSRQNQRRPFSSSDSDKSVTLASSDCTKLPFKCCESVIHSSP